MYELDLGLAVLRVVVGLTFAAHGLQKARSLDGTAGWFDSMGMRPGRLHARLAAGTEIGAGVLLALGLLTAFAGAGMVGVMVVAGYTVHRGTFFIVKNGWEYNLILAVIGVSLATTGPGGWSLDDVIGIDLDGIAGLAIALVGGVGGGAAQLAAFYRPAVGSDA
ncbi:MAG: DoxX family protein [Actinomycetota bacterium]|nr:DoxX family protein [Actinomycetota bacterium]